MATLNDRINIRGTADKWAQYVVKDWQNQLFRMKIGQTGELNNIKRRSLVTKDMAQFIFEYAGQGDFVRWGVGRGVKIEDVRGNSLAYSALSSLNLSVKERKALRGRRAKRWLGKKLRFNLYRLQEIMAKKYATELPGAIKINIESK